MPVAARILLAFGMLFKAAWEAGRLRIPAAYTTMSPELRATAVQLMSDLSRDEQAPEVLLTTLTARGMLHSLVWAELYGHFPPGVIEFWRVLQPGSERDQCALGPCRVGGASTRVALRVVGRSVSL